MSTTLIYHPFSEVIYIQMNLAKNYLCLSPVKPKNQPGLTIPKVGQSQKLSAKCLLPSKTWWSGYNKTEIQLILILVWKKKSC